MSIIVNGDTQPLPNSTLAALLILLSRDSVRCVATRIYSALAYASTDLSVIESKSFILRGAEMEFPTSGQTQLYGCALRAAVTGTRDTNLRAISDAFAPRSRHAHGRCAQLREKSGQLFGICSKTNRTILLNAGCRLHARPLARLCSARVI